MASKVFAAPPVLEPVESTWPSLALCHHVCKQASCWDSVLKKSKARSCLLCVCWEPHIQ